jgi:hypothetical protein
MKRRQVAGILILIVDVACVAWGATAAVTPDGLPGPGAKAILPAGYEGYSGGSRSELLRTSPMTAKYMIVLFRTYCLHCVVFGNAPTAPSHPTDEVTCVVSATCGGRMSLP